MKEKQMHGLRARLDYLLKHNLFVYKAFDKIVSNGLRIWGLVIPMNKKMVVFRPIQENTMIAQRQYMSV